MNYKDSIKWLESLKQQIGQAQHSDLWHFEQAIDETIDNLRPLAEPHGRLIDADYLIKVLQDTLDNYSDNYNDGKTVEKLVVDVCKQYIDHCPTIIDAEVTNP